MVETLDVAITTDGLYQMLTVTHEREETGYIFDGYGILFWPDATYEAGEIRIRSYSEAEIFEKMLKGEVEIIRDTYRMENGGISSSET